MIIVKLLAAMMAINSGGVSTVVGTRTVRDGGGVGESFSEATELAE